MTTSPPTAISHLATALRAVSRLALGLALLSVLGGGSFHCSWTSGNHDDDDRSQPDDDDDGLAPLPDDGGGGGSGDGGGALAQRLADLAWSADVAPSAAALSAPWPELPPEAYTLQHYVEVPGGAGQPELLRLVDVAGLSLLDTWGPGTYGAAAFAAFGARVLDANPELLALPPGAGALLPAGAVFLDDLVLVRWLQTPHAGDGPEAALPGAALTMAFDLVGRLIHIENAVEVPEA